MNKNEILERSRKENKDEGVEYINQKGRALGITVMSVVFVIVILYNIFAGVSNNPVFTVFWAYLTAEAYGRYRVAPSRSLWFTVWTSGLVAVLFFINHVIRTFPLW